MTLRNGLIAGGFLLIAVVAAIGWTRAERAQTPVDQLGSYAPYAQSAGYNSQPDTARNSVVYQNEQNYPQDRYIQSIRRPVVVRQYSEPQRVYTDPRTVYTTTEVREVHRHGRSEKKSVAIVAGSAGVGAAVGALAGGGKGAGIGALAGGTGGFVYDRLTHNR